jgi:L-rhamnose isomerase
MSKVPTSGQIEQVYELARQRFAALGVDSDEALRRLAQIPISLHCWQGDDVGGFENPDQALGGGLMTTGNYPGKARTAVELREDLDQAYSLIPGTNRLNLHAIYLESYTTIARNEILPEHFAAWAAWAKENNHGIDFNPTLFSHPLADDGFTLSHRDPGVRDFWIEHCIACREIGAYFGRELGTPAVTNIWIPDGMKDTPVDRKTPRLLLADSLDTRATILTPSKPSCSVWVLKATWSAPMSSTWATPPLARSYSASTPVTSTPRRPSPIRFRPCLCMSPSCCCMSAAACAGTAIMWSP